jgi:hypothetical protein
LFEFQQCEWSGHTYTNLLIGEGATVLGLRFLARHLVTLDLPNDRLYLKRRTDAPLRGDWYLKAKRQQQSITEPKQNTSPASNRRAGFPPFLREKLVYHSCALETAR